jgi:glycosyltransferase involved in cell wall biosynthesis
MNILVLNYEFPPLGGGASPVTYELCKGYASRGHKVTVVTMRASGLPHHERVDGMDVFRVNSIRTKHYKCNPLEQFTYLISAKRFLSKQLKQHKYHICHTHFLVPTGILARWVKRQFGIPYIITVHGSDIPGYNPDRFKLLHLVTPPVLRKITADCEYLISSSEYLLKMVESNVAPLGRKGLKIPNGTQLRDVDFSRKQKIVLSTGRLLKRKGFQYLIEAARNMETDYELHICGDGPMMKSLKKFAADSKMKIVFHGWLDNRSGIYLDLLQRSSIYCLLSEKENASLSLLEAMSAGCAVITANTTGCIELLENAGLAISPRDTVSLKKKLGALMGNPNLTRQYGERAYKKARDFHNWEKIVEEYETLLLGSPQETQ